MSDNATYFGEFVDTYRQFFIHLNNAHNLPLFYETLASMGFVSSVRSSSGYHGLLQATFSNFSNSSDSKVKVKVKGPNMCYIFEKHGIQGYRI